MRKLEKQREALVVELAAVDPTDHVALAEVGHRLAEVDAAHTAAEDEWLALAEEAEG
jgi:hypothetical protein